MANIPINHRARQLLSGQQWQLTGTYKHKQANTHTDERVKDDDRGCEHLQGPRVSLLILKGNKDYLISYNTLIFFTDSPMQCSKLRKIIIDDVLWLVLILLLKISMTKITLKFYF